MLRMLAQNENNLQEIQFVSTRVTMDVLNLIESLVRGFLQFLDQNPALCPKAEIKTDKPITDAKVVRFIFVLLRNFAIRNNKHPFRDCKSLPFDAWM